MTRTRTALIIGGGIAGPATAMALQKAGIDPVIYEAYPAGAYGTGAFLTLAPNGIDALRILGADKPALAAGFPTPAITLRSYTGKRLGQTRTGGSLPDGTASHTIKRADLYRVLLDEAASRGLRIEHGKRLIAAEQVGDRVQAAFADGSTAQGDVLIGCDGVHSTVRSIIDPEAPTPTYAGLLNTGGYAHGVQASNGPGHYEMIFGKRAFFGYVAAPGGQVWWFANLPRRGDPARGQTQALSDRAWRAQLAEAYAGDAGPATDLIEATPQLMATTPVHTLPHLPGWYHRQMIVIGDAAHAPSPTSGQGASLAIEDAVVLAQFLRDQPSAQAAFAAFEAARRPRVERIIKWAARINNSKAAGPIARIFRDAMLPVILAMTANSKAQKQAYDYHINWDGPTPAAA